MPKPQPQARLVATPKPKPSHAARVSAAGAHDLNEELTIMLSAVEAAIVSLEPGHPARPLLFDIQTAAQRCAWKVSGLLKYTEAKGAKPSPEVIEYVIAQEPA